MSLYLWEPPDKPQRMPDPEPNGGGLIVWLVGVFLFWCAASLIVALIYLPK